MRQPKFLIYNWHFFGLRFIKMVRLTLETNTFVIIEYMFIWNVVLLATISGKDFQAIIFFNIYFFLCRRAFFFFFPIVQFNWISYFGEISTQLNIHYWGNGPAIFLTKKTVSGMWTSQQNHENWSVLYNYYIYFVWDCLSSRATLSPQELLSSIF